MPAPLICRRALPPDLPAICEIYNQGVEDRLATLETACRSLAEMDAWFTQRDPRYTVLVAENAEKTIEGWASLNPYSHRCAYSGVADLSVYVARGKRGKGVGSALLREIEREAKREGFHKIVLFTLPFNVAGQRLYRKMEYREVGLFREQGRLDGRFVDVMAMEKVLRPFVLFVCKHNTGRSQMAEAYLRKLAGAHIDVASAGTIAAREPDAGVVAAMAEDGIDLSGARPKLLDTAMVQRADRVITMGCDVEGVPRIDADWALPDPKGQSAARIREIRDLVKTKALALARELQER